jgi:hypothetical protein
MDCFLGYDSADTSVLEERIACIFSVHTGYSETSDTIYTSGLHTFLISKNNYHAPPI